jgi:hypothetical protein
MKSGILSCVLICTLLSAAVGSAQLQASFRQLIFRAGYDNGPALINLQLQNQRRLFGVTQASILQYVIWQCDGGSSSIQIERRRAGSLQLLTPLMVPALVGSVTGTIACASWDGNNRTWEGNSIPCSKIGSIGLANGDTLETTGNPVADGVSKSCSAFVVVQ